MNRFRQFFAHLINRLAGRVHRRSALVPYLRPIEARSDNQESSRSRSNDKSHAGFANPWNEPPSEARAAGEIFVNHQGEEHHFDYREVDAAGSIHRDSENWIFGADGIRLVQRRSFARLAGGVIAQPSQIRGFCIHCGKYTDTNSVRCFECGSTCCLGCGRVILDGESRPVILCRTHAKEFRRRFSTWRGTSSGGMLPVPVNPPSNQSVVSLFGRSVSNEQEQP